jgi:hypothetical protein
MIQPLSEADHICQNLQVHFDRMLCNVLEKYYLFSGFTLLLGSLCQHANLKLTPGLGPGMVASSYLIRQWGEGHILDETGFLGAYGIYPDNQSIFLLPGTQEFFNYLTGFLENPVQSGICFFDQLQYAIAAKECLQLYLCSHQIFSKRATEFACYDKVLCRNKPWKWLAQLGIHSRIWKARHHLKVQQLNSVKAQVIYQGDSYPENSPEHQYLHFLSYQLVSESPVWSGYWVPMSANQDQDWLACPRKPKITGLNWY